jgi:hypothetical protein
MKKTLFLVTVTAVFMMSGTAFSQVTVEWKGVHWNAYQAARITVNHDGYLAVEPTSLFGGAAYYRAPIDFRSAKTPWIEATFFDDVQSTGTQLVMKNRSRAYTEIGARDTHKNYMIYWFNYQSGSNGLVDTSITRTPGQHTVRLGMQENGTVDYWIDDRRVWSNNNINPESFENIFLAAQASTATFIDYQVGTDYSAPQSVVYINIDIKPGGNPNSINLRSKGVVPVAIMTTDEFDADTINPETVRFATATGVRWTAQDVDFDGDMDLLFHFKTQELDLTEDSTEATLRGETIEGKPIVGTDTVNIVPQNKNRANRGK